MYQFFKRKSFLHYYLPLIILVLGSFYFFSYWGSSFLNVDDIVVLEMAENYHIPADLYYWGQYKFGSLIPFISQVGIYLGISTLWSVSISIYFILILGFIGFSSFLEKKESKLILALLMFFPFVKFIDFLKFPIGMEYCLLGFSLYLLKQRLPFILRHKPVSFLKFTKETTRKKIVAIGNFLVYLAQLSIAPFFILSAVWVSDFTFISLVVWWIVFECYRKTNHTFKHQAKVISFSILIAFLLVSSLKSLSDIETENNVLINNFSEFLQGFQLILYSIFSKLIFKNGEILMGVYVWLALIFVGCSIYEILRQKAYKIIFKNPYIVVFLADFCVLFLIILMSKWALSNEMGSWYFCGAYITFSYFLLLLLEKMQVKIYLKSLLWGLVILGAFSSIIYSKKDHVENLKPTTKFASNLPHLGLAQMG